jgi:hypothetical protein
MLKNCFKAPRGCLCGGVFWASGWFRNQVTKNKRISVLNGDTSQLIAFAFSLLPLFQFLHIHQPFVKTIQRH